MDMVIYDIVRIAMKNIHNNQGFTLIEIFLVVVIICVLSAVGFWVFSQRGVKTDSNTQEQNKPNFTIDLPAGWVVSTQDSSEKVIASPDYKLAENGTEKPKVEQGSQIRVNEVTHSIDQEGKQRHLTADNYIDTMFSDTKSQVTEQKKTTINGHQVLQFTYNHETTYTLFFVNDTTYIQVSIWYPSSKTNMGADPNYNLVLNSLTY